MRTWKLLLLHSPFSCDFASSVLCVCVCVCVYVCVDQISFWISALFVKDTNSFQNCSTVETLQQQDKWRVRVSVTLHGCMREPAKFLLCVCYAVILSLCVCVCMCVCVCVCVCVLYLCVSVGGLQLKLSDGLPHPLLHTHPWRLHYRQRVVISI